MTDHPLQISDAEHEQLELVRQQQGLESVEQAAEWLAKTAIRRAARKTSGRGRALYPVTKPSKEGQ